MKTGILTITTKGCIGCYIIQNLVKEAIDLYGTRILYYAKDVSEIDKEFLKKNNIVDFPTTLFLKDEVVQDKFIGTKPATIILRLINKVYSSRTS